MCSPAFLPRTKQPYDPSLDAEHSETQQNPERGVVNARSTSSEPAGTISRLGVAACGPSSVRNEMAIALVARM